MIYAGKKANDTGDATVIGNSQYNSKYWDPTYVGYKYNEKLVLNSNNETTEYNWFVNTNKYNYGTSYSFDETTKIFTLTGTIRKLTWKDDHDEIVKGNLYTCLDTGCNVLYKVIGYSSDTVMIVQPITYGNANYRDTLINTANSTIKTTLDAWYENNMMGYTSYLADTTFCNDRSLTSGSGYLITSATTYGSYDRLLARTPNLKCLQDSDKFKVSNKNAKLDYSVSLITADEVSMAGGVYGVANNSYYLYNGQYIWTLSPAKFYSNYSNASVWLMYDYGGLGWEFVSHSIGIRPVINLKQDVEIMSGDGTSIAPFKIKIS